MHKLKSILLIIFVILIFQGNEEPSLAEEDKGEGEYMTVAYDKAEWHYEGDFPEGLDED